MNNVTTQVEKLPARLPRAISGSRLDLMRDRLRFVSDMVGSRDATGPIRSSALLQWHEQLPARVFPLVDEVVVGRDQGCQIVCDDPKLSRRHFRVFPRQGACWLEDLNSQNGVQVNGKPIKLRQLLDGDVISAAQQIFVYKSVESEVK